MSTFSILFLAVGICYLIIGAIFKKWPPKKINGLYGYRTGKAMHSQKAWNISQSYSAKHILWQGLIFTLLGAISSLLPSSNAAWAVVLEAILPIGSILFGVGHMIYSTEKYVDKNL